VIDGGVNTTVFPQICIGQTVTVDASGSATISLAAQSGLALQAGVSVP